MIAFNVWTRSPNTITLYLPDFEEELDSFELLFVLRLRCLEVTLPVESVKKCEGRVVFSFSVDCELQSGTHEVTLVNKTKSKNIFSEYPANVYDIPEECAPNDLL